MASALGIIFSFYDYAVFAIVVSIILMNEITGGDSSFSVYIGISFSPLENCLSIFESVKDQVTISI